MVASDLIQSDDFSNHADRESDKKNNEQNGVESVSQLKSLDSPSKGLPNSNNFLQIPPK